MEQEISVSDSVIRYLSQNIKPYGKGIEYECINILSDNYIVDDENNTIFKMFDKAIELINTDDPFELGKKTYFKEQLKTWLEKNRRKINNVYESDWNNDVLELCKLSQDKILFDTSLGDKEIKSIRKKIFDIEIHNLNTFLQPDSSYRLKHLPLKIKLEQDICYNLNNILFPFIRNAKYLVIVEPYISSWQNIVNFKKLTEIIPKSITCEIIKFRNAQDEKSKKELSDFEEFIKVSNHDGYNFVVNHPKLPHNKSSKHIERYIITDKYEIYLPGGFNCLDENGYSNVSGDYDIKEINVKKRELKN